MTSADHRSVTLKPAAGLISDDLVATGFPRIALGLVVAYLVVGRAVADIYTVPIGVSLHPTDLIGFALLAVWGLWMMTSPQPFPIGLATGLGAAFTVAFLLAPVVNAGNLSEYEANGVENGLVRGALLVGLFLASYHLGSSQRAAIRILVTTVAVTLFQAVIALSEALSGTPFLGLGSLWQSLGLEVDPRAIRSVTLVLDQRLTGELRPAATAPHPLVLAGLMAVALGICAAFYFYSESRRTRIWLLGAMTVELVALAATNQRTAIVALAALVLVVVLTQMHRLPSALPLVAVSALGAAAVFVLSPNTPRLVLNFITGQQTDQNVAVRLSKYEIFGDLIEKRPVLGAGFATNDPVLVTFDNDYLTGLVELGIVGFALLVAFLLVVAGRSFAALGRAPRAEQPLLLSAVLAATVLFTTMATFDVMSFAQMFPSVLIVLAIGLARADALHRNEQSTPAGSLHP